MSFQLPSLPSLGMEKLSKNFDYIFQDLPKGLSSFKGIEHQILLIIGLSLPNTLAYISNTEETKEIQREVEKT